MGSEGNAVGMRKLSSTSTHTLPSLVYHEDVFSPPPAGEGMGSRDAERYLAPVDKE
jgi:hypothetical protein